MTAEHPDGLADGSDEPGILPRDADPPEGRRAATPLGAAVARLLRRLLPEDPAWLREIVAHWPECAGTEVARYTRPGRFDRGILYVFVSTSARLAEIRRYGLQSLEARLRQRAGPQRLRAVRLQLDPRDQRPAPAAPPPRS